MTERNDRDRLEAIQIVVDRVSAYQDAAPEGTVANELAKGFAEAGIDLGHGEITRLAEAIQDVHGTVDASAVLG